MTSGVRHIVLKMKIHVKLRSLNNNNLTPPEMFKTCFFAIIFTTSFFRNPYPDEKYSGTSLQSSQNGSNIQDDEVTSVHRCTLSILSKAQI